MRARNRRVCNYRVRGQPSYDRCRDENIRVFDGSDRLVHVFQGHFDEVSCLVSAGDGVIVSGSLDGTVRVWKLNEIGTIGKEVLKTVEVEEVKVDLMTAEEEAELLALMGDCEVMGYD
jgi:WD40 repeat protein